VELAIGRFPFSSSSESDSDEYEDAAPDNKTLSSLPEDSTFEGGRFDNGEDTLKGEGTTKGDEVEMGERIRLAERQAARLSTSIPQSSMIPIPQPRKKKVPAQQHQMSIFDLVQYIVNEPAPQLPLEVKGAGGRGKWSFSQEMREFIDSTLRKEPVGGEKRKKGEVGRPTPRQLLVRYLPRMFST
jgi:mitogen-activated protein kinase kinase